MLLALDVGGADIARALDRVEFDVELVVDILARADCAALYPCDFVGRYGISPPAKFPTFRRVWW